MDLSKFWSPHAGAVSLTFDDGTQNQLERAVPALNEFGLKGTFYLCPRGDDWQERFEPWTEVASSGHEIGNHTLSHICSRNIPLITGGLEQKTLGEIEDDILAAQERLAQLARQQKQWTFAYPCYCTHVGGGRSRQSYVPIVAKHFLAGRVGGEYGLGNHPATVDLASAWGLAVERMSGFEMIGLAEELAARGQWAILVFHEISGSRLTVGDYDFRMLLNHLRRRSDAIWTAPVASVAQKIAAVQATL